MQDDMTEDSGKWLPDEGWITVKITKMEEGTSSTGNPKYIMDFQDPKDDMNVLPQDLTNIPGKRWLLRQLLGACGIEAKENEFGRKMYNWEIGELLEKTVRAKITHDKTPFTDREGNQRVVPKAKISQFKKVEEV